MKKNKAYLFIDADNQSHARADRLIEGVNQLGCDAQQVYLAGNNCGKSLMRWNECILRHIESGSVMFYKTAQKKEFADYALLFFMGKVFQNGDSPHEKTIVIVSSDRIFVKAGLVLQECGFRVFLASVKQPKNVAPLNWLSLKSGANDEGFFPDEPDCRLNLSPGSERMGVVIDRVDRLLEKSDDRSLSFCDLSNLLAKMGYSKAQRKIIIGQLPNRVREEVDRFGHKTFFFRHPQAQSGFAS